MSHSRTIADLEADIVALRASAERAGTALACLFSSSDEFEAEVVRVRREQGAYRARSRGRYSLRAAALVALLALVFLLF
jgi:DNA invertase Pin-like site-specific DNA recombinase